MIKLADRWGKLPEEIRRMDARNLHLLAVVKRGTREGVNDAQ